MNLKGGYLKLKPMAFTPSNPPNSGGFPPRSTGRFPNPNFSKDEHRINERIRVPQVRLIDENGGQVGVVATIDALRMARERNLDLLEVSPNSNPPVCKICDYGKFKYEKKKKENQAKKKQVVIKVKEMQFRPSIEEHDLDYKLKAIRSFIEEGDKAKLVIMFRGREIAHTQHGFDILKKVSEALKDIAITETPAKLEGKKLMMILAPAPKKT
ncbi:MAG: translation initiation factor IF-3 [Xanthomonadaceae bacterium]|nr:translation initiation factor IF-3 [Xanthomonadaceae bacterium]